MISVIERAASTASMLKARSGRPPRPSKILSGSPMREPRPAATMIAAAEGAESRSGRMFGGREHHSSGTCLEKTNDGDRRLLADEPTAAVNHDHSAVVKEPDALASFRTFLDHFERDLLAGLHERPKRVGELVQVQYPDSLDLCDAVQVEVVRQDAVAARPGEFHKFRIDLALLANRVFE